MLLRENFQKWLHVVEQIHYFENLVNKGKEGSIHIALPVQIILMGNKIVDQGKFFI